jgi:hypothetical protein
MEWYGPQELFATKALIDASNRVLRAAGAFVTVKADTGPAFRGLGRRELHKVKLEWIGGDRAQGYHKEVEKQAGPGYKSFADCHRTAQSVIGSNSGGAVIDTERPVVAGGVTLPIPSPKEAR